MGHSLDGDDPFSQILAPPINESVEERFERERREAEAKRISDEIDEILRSEKLSSKKRKKPVKVLLLGQSESGKSTTLKNFQLTYARKAWQDERTSWRAVIQLNLLRSVTLILDLLALELEGTTSPNSALLSLPSMDDPLSGDDEEDEDDSRTANGHGYSSRPKTPQRPRTMGSSQVIHVQLTEKHRLLKLRLAPLKRVQRDLELRLGAEEASPYEGEGVGAAPFHHSAVNPNVGTSYGHVNPRISSRRPTEFYVRSSTGWKSALEKLRPRVSISSRDDSREGKSKREREVEETNLIISGCRDDMKTLWDDQAVRALLEKRRVRLEESGGFFLDDVERVAAIDYEPSDDDIIRARLRTMGVQEHHFLFERGSEVGHEWLMYDVGGTRSLRQAWAPFFDDVNAIIFLAPISCFDEKLAEDPRVNRLEDSFLLWKAVVSNKLLKRTQIILFLNKCDLLDKKLKDGVKFEKYVPSYGSERTNTLPLVSKYLRQKFRDISKQYSPEPRPFYVHLTSVIDTKATAITLGAVREGILREHLRGADFL